MNAAPAPAPPLAISLKGWATVSRIPFLSVGVLPYLLGVRIATWAGAPLNLPVMWAGLIAVVLIMLATYFNGEYADVAEDTISTEQGRNPFAGGSGGVVDGLVTPQQARVGGNVVTALAIGIGLGLALIAKTGVWTIPLGVFGLVAGYFYSMRPFRWVQRGVGELFIGICYGWLPVTVGYYLQASLGGSRFGELPGLLWWVSMPVGITIFNVIFMNEFPDYEGDVAVGKRNLLVRLDREAGVFVYVAAVVLATASFYYALTFAERPPWLWFGAVTAVSLVPTSMMLAGMWRKRPMLVPMCGLTIVANLATTGVLVASFWPAV